MDFKNVKLDDYYFNLELHKSMFFIDMLKDTYEFTLKGDEIEIFKKLKNGISVCNFSSPHKYPSR